MKATKQVDKIVLDKGSFVRNELHLEVTEIIKTY